MRAYKGFEQSWSLKCGIELGLGQTEDGILAYHRYWPPPAVQKSSWPHGFSSANLHLSDVKSWV